MNDASLLFTPYKINSPSYSKGTYTTPQRTPGRQGHDTSISELDELGQYVQKIGNQPKIVEVNTPIEDDETYDATATVQDETVDEYQ